MGGQHTPKWEGQYGSGFWKDFGKGFKKGFSSTVGLAKDVVPLAGTVAKLSGKGQRRHKRSCCHQRGGWGFSLGPVGVNF